MSLYVNPISVTPCNEGVIVAPEIMFFYPEGSLEFEYIRELIGEWDYYISRTVTIPNAVAKITVQANDVYVEKNSRCAAYIYGWMPGSAEWVEGLCTAIVYFETPKIEVQEAPMSCHITVEIESEILRIARQRTVPIYYSIESFTEEVKA